MHSLEEITDSLTNDRDAIVDNLTTMGIEDLEGNETFTELATRILDIPSGGTSIQVNLYDISTGDQNEALMDFLTNHPGETQYVFLKGVEWFNDINQDTEYVDGFGILTAPQNINDGGVAAIMTTRGFFIVIIDGSYDDNTGDLTVTAYVNDYYVFYYDYEDRVSQLEQRVSALEGN